jgi:hypothetical protein
MRKERHMESAGRRRLARLGALAVVATGALCAVVLSIASRAPPGPADEAQIPGIVIGSSARGDPAADVRRGAPPTRERRAGRSRSGVRGGRAAERRRGGSGGAAHGKARGELRAGDEGPAGPGPRSGDDGPDLPGPGPRTDDDTPRLPGPGAGDDDGGSQPSPAPPAPAHADDPLDDDAGSRAAPLPTGTTGVQEADDDAAPTGRATPAPEVDSEDAETPDGD